MSDYRETPFGNASLSLEERLDWLLSELTMDEKLRCFATRVPDFERLGIRGVSVGGEAAHGVEARNDQNTLGAPEPTTSFPQPIGMSATWDPELLKEAGAVTGTEARVLYHRHRDRGLSRWAPTIDLGRDPRWGRNEECYGEDPVLTGAMSSGYIQGMQGDDPKYLRIAATLKHFYANNTEVGRGWKNSSIDPRNKYELYLEPFRRAIEDGGAEAIMTAYNKINGTPGMLNPEVKNILKKQYGLKHAVCDGGAMELVVNYHHTYGMHAETLANAVKAGVDGMSDNPVVVEYAAREAYELGLLSEEDINGALRNMFRTKLRLGVYDSEPRNPYDNVTEEDLNSEASQKICKQVSLESVVLLKNENHTLPLDKGAAGDLALVGPMADVWYQDWYGGQPPYVTTLRQGMEKIGGAGISYADGLDRVVFRCKGQGVAISGDNHLCLAAEPDVFIKEDWGNGSLTFRSVRTGKYMGSVMGGILNEKVDTGRIDVEKDAPFDWFVMEIFHLTEQPDGTVKLSNRFYDPICVEEDGSIRAKRGQEGSAFTMEVVEHGLDGVLETVKGKKQVVLALGCNSMINAKEEVDRFDIALPPAQQELLDAVYEVNPNIVLVLFSNYPYTMKGMEKKVPAVVWSATGSQDMGTAMAEVLYGDYAPAGRLNMTWYQDDSQIPDIDDYDIIKGKRTYRYFDGEVQYPFGYGLTYTTFAYSNPDVKLADKVTLKISFDVTNTGDTASDEVAQVYATAPASRVKKPLKQLLCFKRMKQVQPGECRHVTFTVPVEELRFYDVISESLMVEEGIYTIKVGPSSEATLLEMEIAVPGRKTTVRDLGKKIKADHYDDYENICLDEGQYGFTAAVVRNWDKSGVLIYRDCVLPGQAEELNLHLMSREGCKVEVLINGKTAGSFEGNTRTYERNPRPLLDPTLKKDEDDRVGSWKPVYADVRIPLHEVPEGAAEITIRMEGDAQLTYFQAR